MSRVATSTKARSPWRGCTPPARRPAPARHQEYTLGRSIHPTSISLIASLRDAFNKKDPADIERKVDALRKRWTPPAGDVPHRLTVKLMELWELLDSESGRRRFVLA